MNSYLLESLDSLSLEKEQNDIIKKEKFLDAPISIYDMQEVPLENALEDLDTYSFLSSQKIIIIENINILKYDDNKKDLDHLFKYIQNPNQDNLLIIKVKELNNTTKIAKELKKLCTYEKVEIDPIKYIKNELKNYNINQNTISYLNELCLGDISKIHNECSKLKDFKVNQKEITKEDIDLLVMKKLGDSKDLTFAFSKCIAEKNKKEALEKYKELLSYNIDPIAIIGLLASQIRIIYQVKILEKRNLRDKEIASILEEKSDYRITKTRELTRLYSEEELLKLMQKLSEIDIKMKTTDTDNNSLIEMFIINLN